MIHFYLDTAPAHVPQIDAERPCDECNACGDPIDNDNYGGEIEHMGMVCERCATELLGRGATRESDHPDRPW